MPIKRQNYDNVRRHFISILGGRCVVCGTNENLELDHIKPNGFGRGRGRDVRLWDWFVSYAENNLQLLCMTCNKEKGDKE